LILAGMFLASGVCGAEEGSGTAQMKSDLSDIKTRLAALEAGQKEILSKENDILKELAIVKIWVHRK
jgi:hypothetical protein